ncbi:TVP38/TMEM64 family protein [Cohnella sp. GbtcB17]|uniref:TVP38/TMEM64 family protein n=1 Tax=Cohnella sp. GbtcB17 TaxID=2824762 RepID=UPI001C2F1ADD|nr:VTT domain-containing protein [Cohnella sp. GbtcB17]
MKKIGWAIVIYGLVVWGFWLYKNELLAWMQSGSLSLWTMLLLAVALAFVPVLPYKLFIAIAAYAYGAPGGALISWFGATVAAVLMYVYARFFLADAAERWLARSPKLQAFAERLGRRPFWFIFVARLVPFLPQPLVNLYAAAAGIRPLPYIAGTALGKLPMMALYAFAGEKLLGILLG